MLIRAEEERDWAAVYALNAAAFETTAEADLVDTLRRELKPIISLVADDAGEIVGHIMFSPVALTGHPDLSIMGLAPMAVAAPRRRSGIGSLLVRAGLDRCMQIGVGAVVVLGHPAYYPRFGFVASVQFCHALRIRRPGRSIHGRGVTIRLSSRCNRHDQLSRRF
jgi:putative acetyltransferase